jgi:cytochrome c-type biogenesis protein CcmH
MSSGRTVAAVLAALVGLLVAIPGAPALAAAPGDRPQVSFTRAQEDFMCTACHEPLNVARSPEAYDENAELRRLIKRGDTIDQIKAGMVAQYGEGVLADPPKHGFAVLLVVIPVAVVVAGLAVLVLTIPRWRRRAARQAAVEARSAEPAISDRDAQRLDADLARRG